MVCIFTILRNHAFALVFPIILFKILSWNNASSIKRMRIDCEMICFVIDNLSNL